MNAKKKELANETPCTVVNILGFFITSNFKHHTCLINIIDWFIQFTEKQLFEQLMSCFDDAEYLNRRNIKFNVTLLELTPNK
ncbi:Hypothetical predicted protein [Octopus vulgaris]|uniref:Uncharacterized protein n=1 Tax=Octopus vulgaris TaxID=6645 RepID=A0AA36B806_OCTVU|nr:Hypothetical predicted protein [Octopus vulgaris]